MALAKPAPLLPPPATAPEVVEETIERDTESGFEDITVELLPGGKFPQALDLFSISVRNAALRGWVKQPSPCCAASSIAGCFNTIRGLERTDKENGAVDAKDVMAVMDGQLSDDRAVKHASCARILGLKDPAILACLEARVGQIQVRNRSRTVRVCLLLPPGCAPPCVMQANLRKLTSRLVPSPSLRPFAGCQGPTPCLTQEGRSQTSRPAPCHEGGDCQGHQRRLRGHRRA